MAFALNVSTPSSVRCTLGSSAFGHSNVRNSRSLRCAQYVNGILGGSPGTGVIVSTNKRPDSA